MGKMQKFVDNQKAELKNLIYRYTVTLLTGALLSILYCIYFELEEQSHLFDRIVLFVIIFLAGVFFIETFFVPEGGQKPWKKLSIALSANGVIALFWVIIQDNLHAIADGIGDLLGTSEYIVGDYIANIFIMYLATMVVLSLYKIIKRSKLSLQTYLPRVIFGLLKVWALFLVLYLAMMFLLVIFDSLIINIDYWDFLDNFTILLAGFLYFPYTLLCIVDTSEENSRFTKGFVNYALLPCVIVAFIIIYMYVVKILFTFSMPQNEVFNICLLVFVFGGPVWFISEGFFKESIKEKTGFGEILEKIATNLKYAYIPLIVLEIIAISIRIYHYGLTEDRYMGIVAIVFQIIYVAWELICKARKRDTKYEELLIVGLIIGVFVLFCPVLNMEKLSFLSQKNRFEKAIEEGKYIEASNVFKYLRYDDYGMEYLEDNYSEEDLASLKENIYQQDPTQAKRDFESVNFYVSSYYRDHGINIKGYTNMYEFSYISDYREIILIEDAGELVISYGVNNNFMCNFDGRDMLETFIDMDKNNEIYTSEMKYKYYTISQNVCLVIEDIDFDYNPYTDEIKGLNFGGYILINEEGHNGQ